jgi:hypothetical protein
VQSTKDECLDHFLFFGQKHLWHLCREWKRQYNEARPHRRWNRPLDDWQHGLVRLRIAVPRWSPPWFLGFCLKFRFAAHLVFELTGMPEHAANGPGGDP